MFNKKLKIVSFLTILLILIICLPFLANFGLFPTSANIGNWVENAYFIRLDSFADLFNYLPDHYKLSEPTEKPTNEDIEKIESFLSKRRKKEVNLNADNIILKSYNLHRDSENILLFSFKDVYKSESGASYMIPLVLCLKYSDGTLFYFDGSIIGNSQGWMQDKFPIYESSYSEDSLEITRIFIYYLTAVNNILLTKDSDNYSQQITLLYSAYIWLFKFEVID